MFEFLQDLCEILLDWPSGTFLVLVVLMLAVAVIVLLILILNVLFNWIDRLTGTSGSGTCTVVNKIFIKGYMRFMPVGKVMVPQFIEDCWEVTFECNGAQGTTAVKHKYYKNVREGDKVYVDFVRGGLTGKLHIKKLY